MIVATIGFTKKSAEESFTLLAQGGVRTLVDVRLNPNAQLAGCVHSGAGVPYFLGGLVGAEYLRLPDLASSKTPLSRYREDGDWGVYEPECGALSVRVPRNTCDILRTNAATRAIGIAANTMYANIAAEC